MQRVHPRHHLSVVLSASHVVLHPKGLVYSLVARNLLHYIMYPQHHPSAFLPASRIILHPNGLVYSRVARNPLRNPLLHIAQHILITTRRLSPHIPIAQSLYRPPHHQLPSVFSPASWNSQILIVVPHSEHLWLVAIITLTHPTLLYHLHNDPSNKVLMHLLGEPLPAGTRHYPRRDGHLIITLWMLPTF